MNEEFVIDIKDILGKLLISWKKTVIFGMLFALLFGCFGIYKLKTDSMNTNNYQELLIDAETNLTADQISSINSLYVQYMNANNLSYSLLYEMSGSMLSKLNSQRIYSVENEYIITSNIVNINEIFKNVLSSDDKAKISDFLNDKVDVNHVDELITVSFNNDNIINNSTTDLYSYVILVDIIADTRENVSFISTIYNDALNNKILELSNSYVVSLDLINQNHDFGSKDMVYDYQKNNIKKLQEINSNISYLTSPNGFSENEIYYYNLLINKSIESNSINLTKLIVLGFAIGIIFALILFIINYLSNTKIKTASEFSMCYQIPIYSTIVFRSISKDPIMNFGKSFLRHTEFSKDFAIESTSVELKRLTEENKIDYIYIANMNTEDEVFDEVIHSLKNQGVNIVVGNPTTDASAKQQMIESKYVVLLVQTGMTSYESIKEIKLFCDRQNVEITGSVVIVTL